MELKALIYNLMPNQKQKIMSNETKGQIEGILTELGKKIDQLIAEAKMAGDDLREDMQEKIEELKVKKQKLEQDFEEYKSSEKWKDAKEHFSSAMGEFKKAVETVFKKPS